VNGVDGECSGQLLDEGIYVFDYGDGLDNGINCYFDGTFEVSAANSACSKSSSLNLTGILT
jgi:hypothetical protein